jgi:hypothetical protein
MFSTNEGSKDYSMLQRGSAVGGQMQMGNVDTQPTSQQQRFI